MKKVAVIGAGSWGTALALTLAQNCPRVTLWARREELAANINETRENTDYLPGVILPEQVSVSTDIEKASRDSDVVLLVVPSHTVRNTARMIIPYLKKDAIVVNCAKGLEEDTFSRMSEVLAEELPSGIQVAVLSGPNHAEEVGRRIPSATVVSANRKQAAQAVQDVLMAPFFRVYTNPDIAGVELGGALKNVIALSAGISEGLSFGDNTKAALMTRGLTEIARLGMKMGADILTFAGLSGIGDLVVTCTSRHSRNRNLGIDIGRGKTLSEALSAMRMVVEGVRTTRAAWHLSERYEVEMPITCQTYNILFENKDPRTAVEDLMRRGRTHETEEIVSSKYGEW